MSTTSTETKVSNAITQAGLWALGIVFVTLKLTDVIDWSWWWVTLPFWGGIALYLSLFFIIVILAALSVGASRTAAAISEVKRRVKNRRDNSR